MTCFCNSYVLYSSSFNKTRKTDTHVQHTYTLFPHVIKILVLPFRKDKPTAHVQDQYRSYLHVSLFKLVFLNSSFGKPQTYPIKCEQFDSGVFKRLVISAVLLASRTEI